MLVLTLVAAAAGGAIWAGIAALLRFRRGVDVVISSLLLVFVAGQVLAYALNNVWIIQEHGADSQRLPESDQISSHVRLPRFGHSPGFNIGTAFVLAVGLALVVWLLLSRSRWGFRLRDPRSQPGCRAPGGHQRALVGGTAIVLSGAFSGSPAA